MASLPETFPAPHSAQKQSPVVLCILDGWGEATADPYNAISKAHTPTWDYLTTHYPKVTLEASESYVGLPQGQMGNSEVGHMTLGAGRVMRQDLPRINLAIEDGSFSRNPALVNAVKSLKKNGKALHIMGLFSPGGVHSHVDHLNALLDILNPYSVPLYLHLFLDGRDTPPQSAFDFLTSFLERGHPPHIKVATMGGRFYGMDRDNRWDRVQKAYEAIIRGKGVHAENSQTAIEESYANGVYDEFVLPTVIGGYAGVMPGDGLLCFNFRADRVREILASFLNPTFDDFERGGGMAPFSVALGMTEYSKEHNAWLQTLFPPLPTTGFLGEVVSQAGLSQLRLAETEKYAHVTFFFNGGVEKPFPNEHRCLIPSPKVSTYDLQPAMSAVEVTDVLTQSLAEKRFDFYVVNFANADMVGHTGNLAAAVEAVTVLDVCLARITEVIKKTNAILLITADHGNIEMMQDPITYAPHTAHTCLKVPCVLVNAPDHLTLNQVSGTLANIAPTVLELLGLEKPYEMACKSLLQD